MLVGLYTVGYVAIVIQLVIAVCVAIAITCIAVYSAAKPENKEKKTTAAVVFATIFTSFAMIVVPVIFFNVITGSTVAGQVYGAFTIATLLGFAVAATWIAVLFTGAKEAVEHVVCTKDGVEVACDTLGAIKTPKPDGPTSTSPAKPGLPIASPVDPKNPTNPNASTGQRTDVQFAIDNDLTSNFQRLAIKDGGFVGSCGDVLFSPSDARASKTSAIGDCARSCSEDVACTAFEFDAAARGDASNCKKWSDGIDRLSMQNPLFNATALTTTQCWATRSMFDATRDSKCGDLTGFAQSDAGCKRVK